MWLLDNKNKVPLHHRLPHLLLHLHPLVLIKVIKGEKSVKVNDYYMIIFKCNFPKSKLIIFNLPISYKG